MTLLREDIGSARYLIPFHPKRHPHFFTDVLVIGSGLAGLQAALAVDSALRVLILCKDGLDHSNSMQAQGGVATVWNAADSFDKHVADTRVAGGELCDAAVVRSVVESGPAAIRRLIGFGTDFDHRADGELLLGREGGHGECRILHALGDATGKEIMRAIIVEVKKRPNIRVWEDTFALDLLTEAGTCRGAVVHWGKEKETEIIWAKQTVLATGGLGQLYRETTNPSVACGDGLAMAYRGGAVLRDLEFVQFHPTVLYIAGGSRSLITEAMRGEGAYLIDSFGDRFMFDYDERGELAPRDVVSRSIVSQMAKTDHPNVYLDLRHKEPNEVHRRFPGIAATCAAFGIDIARDPIPVRPGAHYAMGGCLVDTDGRTTLPGLWGAGEVSSTGLHGANRLASNSLLEALVYGERVGKSASIAAEQIPDDYRALPIENRPISAPAPGYTPSGAPGGGGDDSGRLDLADLRNALKAVMWRHVGVVRDGRGLAEALGNVERWSKYLFSRQFSTVEGWELQNMLTVARILIVGAMSREETRGSHNRADYPMRGESAEHTLFSIADKKGGTNELPK